MSNTFDFNSPGRLASDPELSFTASGSARTTFRVAVDDRRQLDSGAWETTQTVFHDVVSFGKKAEAIAGMYMKGDAVLIMGKLKASINTTNDKTYTNWDIHVSHMAPNPALAVVTIDRSNRAQAASATMAQEHEQAATWSAPTAEQSPGIDS